MPSIEVQFSAPQGLKVDTEMHIVLPGCPTKRGTLDELLKKKGTGLGLWKKSGKNEDSGASDALNGKSKC